MVSLQRISPAASAKSNYQVVQIIVRRPDKGPTGWGQTPSASRGRPAAPSIETPFIKPT